MKSFFGSPVSKPESLREQGSLEPLLRVRGCLQPQSRCGAEDVLSETQEALHVDFLNPGILKLDSAKCDVLPQLVSLTLVCP